MARDFAGYLGSWAMAITLVRGVIHNAGVEGTLLQSVAALAGMAAVGLLLGVLAENAVDESVRTQLEARLAELDAQQQALEAT